MLNINKDLYTDSGTPPPIPPPFDLRETIKLETTSTKVQLPNNDVDDEDGTARARLNLTEEQFEAVEEAHKKPQQKILNLLDHGGVITKKRGIAGFGSGLVSLIQSLLLSTLFGYLLAASGMFAGVKTLISSFMGEMDLAIDPLTENLDEFFKEAEERDVSRKELVDRLQKKAVTHKLTTRVQKYAVISLLGRGGGSVGLTLVSGAIALTSLGHIPSLVTSLTNMSFMAKQSWDIVKDEIITYRFMHHPEIVKSRVEMLVDYHTDNTKKAEKRLMHEVARELVADKERIGAQALDGFMSVIMSHLDGRQHDQHKVGILFNTLADILETPPPIKPEPSRTAEDMMKRFAGNVFNGRVAAM